MLNAAFCILPAFNLYESLVAHQVGKYHREAARRSEILSAQVIVAVQSPPVIEGFILI